MTNERVKRYDRKTNSKINRKIDRKINAPSPSSPCAPLVPPSLPPTPPITPPYNPPTTPTPSPKREAPVGAAPAVEAKKSFGAYGWVKLTESEYNRLLNDFGQAEVNRCIAYVDEAAQTTGNKNKWRDWNLVVRKCHRDRWGVSQWQKVANAPAPAVDTYSRGENGRRDDMDIIRALMENERKNDPDWIA